MSYARNTRRKLRRRDTNQLAPGVRAKIKAGKFPPFLFGANGIQKLMITQGRWKLPNEVATHVGNHIPSMRTFDFMAGRWARGVDTWVNGMAPGEVGVTNRARRDYRS